MQQAISNLKDNKSPSPDGYINEFYKTFKEIISPLLLEAYHHVLLYSDMAPSWNDATVDFCSNFVNTFCQNGC